MGHNDSVNCNFGFGNKDKNINFATSVSGLMVFLNKKRFFALSFSRKSPIFKTTKEKAVNKSAHACRISTPRQGVSISDMAWEWTVYL